MFDKYEKALEYEIFIKKEYSILDEFIINSKIIFDIGGHVGFFSKYCLNLKRDNNFDIHFFEPVKSNFDKALMYLNGNSNIIFNNLGIWTESRQMSMFINNTKTMQSSLFNNNFLNNTNNKELSNFVTLSKYLLDNNIGLIDLMKIDIEGSEFDVLLDLSDDILLKVKVLFFEYHILNDDMSYKYKILVEKLNKIYRNIDIKNSIYSNKLGYVLCY